MDYSWILKIEALLVKYRKRVDMAVVKNFGYFPSGNAEFDKDIDCMNYYENILRNVSPDRYISYLKEFDL